MVLSIAMEYMEGGSLAKVIEEFGPLPEAVVAGYARQV
jgi:serine/threonine protein kinase